MLIRFSIGLAALLVGLSAQASWWEDDEWQYGTLLDEFTDRMRHHAWGMGEYDDGPTRMLVLCVDDSLGVFWHFKGIYPEGTNKLVEMRFRWDDGGVEEATVGAVDFGLGVDSDNMLVSPSSAVWARKAMEHSKLRINFYRRWSDAVTATYTMKGAKDPIRKVLGACGIEDLDVPERTE